MKEAKVRTWANIAGALTFAGALLKANRLANGQQR